MYMESTPQPIRAPPCLQVAYFLQWPKSDPDLAPRKAKWNNPECLWRRSVVCDTPFWLKSPLLPFNSRLHESRFPVLVVHVGALAGSCLLSLVVDPHCRMRVFRDASVPRLAESGTQPRSLNCRSGLKPCNTFTDSAILPLQGCIDLYMLTS